MQLWFTNVINSKNDYCILKNFWNFILVKNITKMWRILVNIHGFRNRSHIFRNHLEKGQPGTTRNNTFQRYNGDKTQTNNYNTQNTYVTKTARKLLERCANICLFCSDHQQKLCQYVSRMRLYVCNVHTQ